MCVRGENGEERHWIFPATAYILKLNWVSSIQNPELIISYRVVYLEKHHWWMDYFWSSYPIWYHYCHYVDTKRISSIPSARKAKTTNIVIYPPNTLIMFECFPIFGRSKWAAFFLLFPGLSRHDYFIWETHSGCN